MQRRISIFRRRGFDAASSDGIADRLLDRDRDRDDRRLCVECSHLATPQWRCRRDGYPTLLLQRCSLFDWELP